MDYTHTKFKNGIVILRLLVSHAEKLRNFRLDFEALHVEENDWHVFNSQEFVSYKHVPFVQHQFQTLAIFT